MRKNITIEFEDGQYNEYFRPLAKKKQLTRLFSQFVDLYIEKKEIRDYFDGLNEQNKKARLKKLEDIINNKGLFYKMGILDAETDDTIAYAKNASRGRFEDFETDTSDTFTFEGDDEEDVNTSSVKSQYATKEDINRLEATIEKMLSMMENGYTAKASSQQYNTSVQDNEPEPKEETGAGEYAGNTLDMLDQMFTFD